MLTTTWADELRERTTLPKLLRMIDYAERLSWMIIDGDDRAWVVGRYKNLRHLLALSIPDSIPHSTPSSPVGEERGRNEGIAKSEVGYA